MTLKDEVIPRSTPDAGGRGKPAARPKPSARQTRWQRLRAPFRHRRNVALAAAALVAVIAALIFGPRLLKSPTADYVTAPVERGSVEDTVTALGNVQPIAYVDVGAQVSGQIQAIHVNIGDKVKKGDLLVEIDPKVQQAKVDQDKAQLAAMQANLIDRQATQKLRQAEAARETMLHQAGADSKDAYEGALAAAASAQAAAKAQLAQIAQAQSSLQADETTLSYSKVTAPMDGTVVSLAVKQGQTINASQQAPAILRVADLSTMTVWTQVSEADVSRLRVGMPAYMTTLGDPNTRHQGKLRQILPTPEIQNNVVLFDVLFDVPNPDQTLMTQMTAQVFFIVASAQNVLTMPAGALQMAQTLGRRNGTSSQSGQRGRSGQGGQGGTQGAESASGQSAAAESGTSAQGAGQSGQRGARSDGAGAPTDAQRQAWRQAHPGGGRGQRQFVMVVKGGTLVRTPVVIGVTNRVTAEVKSGLNEGDQLVVGRKQTQKASTPAARSPIQTQSPGGGGFGGRGPGGGG